MILGTVQIGLNYGISNQTGKPTFQQAEELFETAYKGGIRLLDTAYNYGDSEKVIGKTNNNRFEIISKLPDLSTFTYTQNVKTIAEIFQTTINRLQSKPLYAYYLHSVDDLKDKGNDIWGKLLQIKEQGMTQRIGYSLYSPKQLDIYFNQFQPDIVQIPMNLLDREFLRTGWLQKLKDHDVEIHVRSVFLQGLLLMDFDTQVKLFPKYISLWKILRDEVLDKQITALDYCLGFIKGIEEIDEIVIGANSSKELEQILASDLVLKSMTSELMSLDENLIYPFNWS
jgi:aryl-alcohol dehydrogenase-like predicted oxidoreductase